MPKQVYDQYRSELTQGKPDTWYDPIKSYLGTLPEWDRTLPGTSDDATYLLSEFRKDITPVEGPLRSGVRSTQEYNKMMGLLDEGDYPGAAAAGIWSGLEAVDAWLSSLGVLGAGVSTPIKATRVIKNLTKLNKGPNKPVLSLLPHEIPKYVGKIPNLKPGMLKGKKVFPIHADLTDGGLAYTGIDSAKLEQGVPLHGGKKYPSLDHARSGNVVWAVQGGEDQLLKKAQNSDYAVVVAMGHDAHKSNTSVNMSALGTVQAYIREGRIKQSNIGRINKLVKTPAGKMKPAVKKDVANFPGIESELDVLKDYFQNVSFDARKRILTQLSTPGAAEMGVPNIPRILRKVEDPDTYGSNLGDALLVLELDKGKNNLVELGVHPGTREHPSYKYGVKGKVIGKFPAPTAYQSVFPDFANPKLAEGRRFDNVIRSSTMSDFNQLLSSDVLKNIQFTPLKHIESPRQAALTLEAARGEWISSGVTKTGGGISPVDFENALKNSDASSTLTPYTKEEVTKGAKDGSFQVFQLGRAKMGSKGGEGGTSQVFFGIKETDYNADYGFTHPDLGPNERAIVGVVNNEPGAKGVAAPGVMGKAIQEGATALDAFAVPSKKYPRGFLPKVYNDYGFVELGRVPFEEKYYSATQLNDLKEYWRSTGWDESLGMPEMVIMKWKGDDAIRSDAIRLINENSSLKPGGQTTGISETAETYSGQPTGPAHGGPPGTSPGNNPGGTGGGIRNSNAPHSGDRYRNVLSELSLLSPNQLQTLGLAPESLLY
jgi:hypothetical protein